MDKIPVVVQGVWYSLVDACKAIRNGEIKQFLADSPQDRKNLMKLLTDLLASMLVSLLVKEALTSSYKTYKKEDMADNPFIVRYHFNLAIIRKMKYTSIRNEKDALKKILYMFVCQNEDLEKAYIGDEFMEEVVKIAREISGREKIPLF